MDGTLWSRSTPQNDAQGDKKKASCGVPRKLPCSISLTFRKRYRHLSSHRNSEGSYPSSDLINCHLS